MSVNYKLIADDDPGGKLETAFESMSKVTESRSRGSFRVNDIMIVAVLGSTDGHEFLDAVEGSNLLPERAKLWLRGEGIDINHPDTAGVLRAMNPNPPHLEKVLAMGNEIVPKYGAGFKAGHLQTAREKRKGSKI